MLNSDITDVTDIIGLKWVTEILALLRSAHKPLRARDIGEQLKVTPSLVNTPIRRLEDRKLIVNEGTGFVLNRDKFKPVADFLTKLSEGE